MIQFIIENETDLNITYIPSLRYGQSVFFYFEYEEGIEKPGLNCGWFEFSCRKDLFERLRGFVLPLVDERNMSILLPKEIECRRIKPESVAEIDKMRKYNEELCEEIERRVKSLKELCEIVSTGLPKLKYPEDHWYENYTKLVDGMIRFDLPFESDLFKELKSAGICDRHLMIRK